MTHLSRSILTGIAGALSSRPIGRALLAGDSVKIAVCGRGCALIEHFLCVDTDLEAVTPRSTRGPGSPGWCGRETSAIRGLASAPTHFLDARCVDHRELV